MSTKHETRTLLRMCAYLEDVIAELDEIGTHEFTEAYLAYVGDITLSRDWRLAFARLLRLGFIMKTGRTMTGHGLLYPMPTYQRVPRSLGDSGSGRTGGAL